MAHGAHPIEPVVEGELLSGESLTHGGQSKDDDGGGGDWDRGAPGGAGGSDVEGGGEGGGEGSGPLGGSQ